MGGRTVARRLLAVLVVAGSALLGAACGSPSTVPRADSGRSTTTAASPSPTTVLAPSTTASSPRTTLATTTTAVPPLPGIEVGPGPQAEYTVQAQAAPGTCHYGYTGADPLPDPRCTPGAVNPQVTQATISSTICVAGYTSSIRPPESITEPEKIESAASYGYTGPLHTAEYDHLIPLELGGDPNDPANLWVEPNDRPGADTTANTKDVLESTLKHLVCSGQMTLDAARQAIATDWVTAYQRYG